jgi:L,D-transpeptidase catalytic domain
MPKILIKLPEDRSKVGALHLVNDDDVAVAGPFPVYGKADRETAAEKGNPGGDPLKLYGDTPYGAFDIVDIVPVSDTGKHHSTNFGSHGVIRLKPKGGPALAAARNGRFGLMIHGGEAATNKGLKPTNGCVRISDADMKSLLEAIALLTIAEAPPSICLIEPGSVAMTAAVGDDSGYNEQDPPPGMTLNWDAIPFPSQPSANHPLQYVRAAFAADGQREGHDREAHDREAHDREVHDRETHEREPSRDPAGDKDKETHSKSI